jgi:hypothetical protein
MDLQFSYTEWWVSMIGKSKLVFVLLIAGMFLAPPAACAADLCNQASAPAGTPGTTESAIKEAVAAREAAASWYTGDPISGKPVTRLATEQDLAKLMDTTPVLEYTNPQVRQRGPRAGPDMDPLMLAWVTPAVIDQWMGAGVLALKGAVTQFNLTINNSGDSTATGVTMICRIYDILGTELLNQTISGIPDLAAGENYTGYIYWTPTFATYFSVNVLTSCTGDSNLTNDNGTWNRFMNGAFFGTAIWADSGSMNGWSGDTGANMWHISTSPESDNDTQHTAPDCWYHGTDGVVSDSYNNGQNVLLKSPNFDFRKMTTGYMLHCAYLFHGRLPTTDAGDVFSQAVSTNSGTTWSEDVVQLIGANLPPGPTGAYYNWYHWYSDLNGDGQAQGNEIGLDIRTEAAGQQAMLGTKFVSNGAVNDVGIYMDDYCIWGQEIFDNCAVEIVTDTSDWRNDTSRNIDCKVTNVGANNQPATFTICFNVSTRVTPWNLVSELVYMENKTVNALTAGASQTITFSTWKPTVANRDYVIRVNISAMRDGDSSNNVDARWVHVSDAKPLVLLVDDNPFGGELYSTDTIGTALRANNIDYGMFYIWTGGDGPTSAMMEKFDGVIWSTGWDNNTITDNGTLTANDQNSIKNYFTKGGSMWLISMEVINDLGASSTFVKNTLHVGSATTNNEFKGTGFSAAQNRAIIPNPMFCVAGHPITDGTMVYTNMVTGTNWTYDMTDILTPDANAKGMFYQNNSKAQDPVNGPFTAISYAGDYRLVFQSFEYKFMAEPNRTAYVKKVIEFLVGGLEMHVETPAGADIKMSVEPGNAAVYTLKIFNAGTKERTVQNMELSGLDRGRQPDGRERGPAGDRPGQR